MSRSYKKTPYCGPKSKSMKKYANRVLRRDNNTYQNSSYKKRFCSYDICDYKFFETFEEYFESRVRQWHIWGQKYGYPYPNHEIEYRKWYKYYKRK